MPETAQGGLKGLGAARLEETQHQSDVARSSCTWHAASRIASVSPLDGVPSNGFEELFKI